MVDMKKRLLIGLMMLCAIILTGCVDADVTVDLEKDGTGTVSYTHLGKISESGTWFEM